MIRRLLIFCLLMIITNVHAAGIKLDLVQLELVDAIKVLAKYAGMNVVISPQVVGQASLHLEDASPIAAFDFLLTANGLAKSRTGNVWLVGLRDELFKYKQEAEKWQQLNYNVEPLHTFIWQIKYGKAVEVAKLIADGQASFLSKRGIMRVDERTNIICIREVRERILSLQRLIKRLDVPAQQIRIEARLVSIDSDYERELGIRFSSLQKNSANDGAGAPRQLTGQYGLLSGVLADGSLLDVKLSALEHDGHAELISSPSLFTTNQQTASIESGEEVPYQEVSEGGGTAIAFKKAVLSLKVTPQILPGEKVLLHLQINQDRPSNRMLQGMPTISTRQIITHAMVKSGQTIVLGGIYETGQEHSQKQLPFMSQIPVLGWLFKEHHTRSNKRELLIFVTPKIIVQTNE